MSGAADAPLLLASSVCTPLEVRRAHIDVRERDHLIEPGELFSERGVQGEGLPRAPGVSTGKNECECRAASFPTSITAKLVSCDSTKLTSPGRRARCPAYPRLFGTEK